MGDSAILIATAESCTGGMIAAALTAKDGASSTFDRGFVTYSNEAKAALLGVQMQLINHHGAVSPQVAKAMARGALLNSNADIALSVTGIAGAGGGSPAKPVGTVYIAIATRQSVRVYPHHFRGNRAQIREKTTKTALKYLATCNRFT